MPGYTYQFVDSVPKQCICKACRLPAQLPVTIVQCQHTVCSSCVRQTQHRNGGLSQRDDSNGSSVICPVDEQIADSASVRPNLELQELINGCMVRCPQEPQGCRWVDVVKNVQSHLESCRHASVPCPENCGALVGKDALRDHLSSACPLRRRQCHSCRASFAPEEFQKHSGSCPQEAVWCENKCGQRVPRRQMASHAATRCPKGEAACGHCSRRFARDTLGAHQLGCQMRLDRCQLDQAATPPPSSVLIGSPGSLSPPTASGTPDGTLGGGSATGVDKERASRQRDKDNVGPQGGLQQRGAPPPVPTRRAASAERLESAVPAPPAPGRTSFDCPLRSCGCRFRGPDRSAVERHAKDAATDHVTLLGDLVRAQRHEIDSLKRRLKHLPLVNNGLLVWRIDNYQEKLRESQLKPDLEFCSPPFYTGRPGYRLQASAFFNGNGANAAGSHLSLYVKLLPGEYDPVLDWPFARPIRMRLLDQSEPSSGGCGTREHLTESFTPEPGWRHFKRPTKEAGAFGFGFPRFASHELLAGAEGCRFVRDGTIFLEIAVLETCTDSA